METSTTLAPMEVEKEESIRDKGLTISKKRKLQIIFQDVRPVRKSTYADAFLNLYKCCIGSGILAAPYTFFKGGYILTSVCYCLVGILIIYSQLMLLKIVDEIEQPNIGFTEITRLILGEKYVIINRFFIIIMQWGCCASYLLFFMEFIEYAFTKHTEVSFVNSLIYLGIAMCIIVPLIFINNMSIFAKFSFISNALITVSLFACVVYFSLELKDYVNYEDIPIAQWRNIPIVLGVAMYSFEGIGILLNVRLSMTNTYEFPKLMIWVFFLGTLQNWFFGLLGGLAYGKQTNQIILFSLGKYSEIFQVFYAVALVISLPLMLLPAFQLIERMTPFRQFIGLEDESGYLIKRTCTRFVQVLMIAGLAIGIPKFVDLISFIGGFSGSALQFYFPMMFYLRWTWKDSPTKNEGIVFIVTMCFGVLMGSVAVVDSIYQIITS